MIDNKNPANTDVYRIFSTPRVGLEPTTLRLTAECSAIELSRIISLKFYIPSKPHTDYNIFLPFCKHPTGRNLIFPLLPSSGQALDRLVTVSSMHCCTSTPALSTSSSSRGLTSLRMGYLILRGASRLDAFSVYPFQAWLPCHGFGKPTGTPAARPSRSSRTKDSSSQISYAHAG